MKSNYYQTMRGNWAARTRRRGSSTFIDSIPYREDSPHNILTCVPRQNSMTRRTYITLRSFSEEEMFNDNKVELAHGPIIVDPQVVSHLLDELARMESDKLSLSEIIDGKDKSLMLCQKRIEKAEERLTDVNGIVRHVEIITITVATIAVALSSFITYLIAK